MRAWIDKLEEGAGEPGGKASTGMRGGERSNLGEPDKMREAHLR